MTGQLDLIPRYFFLVTNWPESSRSGDFLLEHYRRRGTFEDRLGEFNGAIGPHLSSQNFKENEATMLLGLLAFNLNTVCRNERPLWSRLTERLERWQQVSDLTPKPSGFTPLPRHAHQREVLRW